MFDFYLANFEFFLILFSIFRATYNDTHDTVEIKFQSTVPMRKFATHSLERGVDIKT